MTSGDLRLIATALDTYVEKYAEEPRAGTDRAEELATHYWGVAIEAEQREAKVGK